MEKAKVINFQELSKAVEEKKVVVVDVRNHSELAETGKLPGSHCVPLPEVAEAFSMDTASFEAKYGFAKPDKDIGPRLVVTCRSGRRVQAAIGELDKIGYSNLTAYLGSYLNWKENNGPLEAYSAQP